jgi:hypothetical protein
MRYVMALACMFMVSGCAQQPVDRARNDYVIANAMNSECEMDFNARIKRCVEYRRARDAEYQRFENMRAR